MVQFFVPNKTNKRMNQKENHSAVGKKLISRVRLKYKNNKQILEKANILPKY
jgi:hypothetical protein